MNDISVVIVNFNSGGLLAQCLGSIAAQHSAPRQVIVVDNASTDGSETAACDLPGVTLLRSGHNVGFAAAMNLGVAAARDSRWIATLNPDAIATPDWMDALARAVERYPDAACFACRLLDAADPSRMDGAGDSYHVSGLPWRHLHGRRDASGPAAGGEVFGPCAAGALYRRSAIEACGGFDEDLFCYVEDVDIAFRMRLLGMRCRYLPDAVVHHIGSATTGRASDFQIYHGHRNLVWVFVKNMPAPLFWPLLPLHLLLNLVSLGWFSARGLGGSIWRAKRDALLGLPAVWRKRRGVQSTRCVSLSDLWRVLDKSPLRLPRRRPA